MKNFKNEIGVLLLGGLLILFSFVSFNNTDQVAIEESEKNSILLNKKSASPKNSRLPSSVKKKNTIPQSNNTLSPVISSHKKPKNLSHIQDILKCLDNYDCSYPNNDPREYNLEVYQDASQKIKASTHAWAQNWNSYSFSDQESIIALFGTDSGYVKENMLSLLNALPREDSKLYYEVVVNDVLNYHDANLINESMKYLENIKDSSNEVEISKDIVNVISSGSPHVAAVVSKYTSSFISDYTKDIFANLAETLPKNSPEVTQVNAAIIEYEMTVSGG